MQSTTRPRLCLVLSVVCASLVCSLQPNIAHAGDESSAVPFDLLALAGAGAGMHESSLPRAERARRVSGAWFPAAAFRLGLSQATGSPLRFGGELTYLTSVGYELSRSVEPNTREESAARKQEFSALARMAVATGDRSSAVLLPITLGYSLSAFSTDTPLVAAQAYVVSGLRAGAGIELPLFAEHLKLSARAELGANLTATEALRDAGVEPVGLAYGFQIEADVRLAEFLQLGVRYREAHVDLPLAGSESFREMHRFVLASVTLRNPH